MKNKLYHYGKVIAEAWAHRDQLGDGSKARQTLEIQERPASPAGRILGWSLMALFAIAVGWAFIGEVNIVTVVEGKIIPGSRVKQIQPLEKGVVKTIFVKEGQAAEIKIHTFPFTKYGMIDAEVVGITADAVVDEQQGLVYKLRLKMQTNQLWVNQQWVDLLPDMLVSAEVKTGHRRLIEFVMAPLLRYKDESARER